MKCMKKMKRHGLEKQEVCGKPAAIYSFTQTVSNGPRVYICLAPKTSLGYVSNNMQVVNKVTQYITSLYHVTAFLHH